MDEREQRRALIGPRIVYELVDGHPRRFAEREPGAVGETYLDGRIGAGLQYVALEDRVALGKLHPRAVGAERRDRSLGRRHLADGLPGPAGCGLCVLPRRGRTGQTRREVGADLRAIPGHKRRRCFKCEETANDDDRAIGTGQDQVRTVTRILGEE